MIATSLSMKAGNLTLKKVTFRVHNAFDCFELY